MVSRLNEMNLTSFFGTQIRLIWNFIVFLLQITNSTHSINAKRCNFLEQGDIFIKVLKPAEMCSWNTKLDNEMICSGWQCGFSSHTQASITSMVCIEGCNKEGAELTRLNPHSHLPSPPPRPIMGNNPLWGLPNIPDGWPGTFSGGSLITWHGRGGEGRLWVQL